VILTLIARFSFVHPFPRKISRRGTKMVAFSVLLCAVYCCLTLVVLTSDFCTCRNITPKELDGREPGDPCSGTCELGPAGGTMCAAAGLWLAAAVAVLKFGIQPEEPLQKDDTHKHYAHYPKHSITSRMLLAANRAGRLRRNWPREEEMAARNSAELNAIAEVENQSEITAVGMHERAVTPEDAESKEKDECEETQIPDTRSCCQKLCFDYRVTPRSPRQKRSFWCFRITLGFLICVYILFIVIKWGSLSESTKAAKAPDTTKYFTAVEVCAYDAEDTMKPFVTFSSKEAAVASNYTVAHCGSCGECSNAQDVRTYVDTRQTVRRCMQMSHFRASILLVLSRMFSLYFLIADRRKSKNMRAQGNLFSLRQPG